MARRGEVLSITAYTRVRKVRCIGKKLEFLLCGKIDARMAGQVVVQPGSTAFLRADNKKVRLGWTVCFHLEVITRLLPLASAATLQGGLIAGWQHIML